MQIIKDSAVTLTIEMRDSDGELLTEDDHKMAYLHGGYGNLFPKLEAALDGKAVGHIAELSLDPKDAFGDYDADLLRIEPRDLFPEVLEIGMQFEGVPGSGEQDDAEDEIEALIYTVTDIADDRVVLDGNHPLAGERLIIKAEVNDVRSATDDELAHGHVHGTHGVSHADH
jgi:FKBP-type peptidyl-prolyl cis-trans isomerase SlyD